MWEGHTNAVEAVALSPDGTRVVSASADKSVKVWDVETGQMIRSLEGHTGSVHAALVTASGDRVIYSSKDWTIRIWNIVSGETIGILSTPSGPVTTVAMVSGDRFLVSGSDDGLLELWDLGMSIIPEKADQPTESVAAMAANDRLVFSASADGTVRAWDLQTKELVRTVKVATNSVDRLVVTSDGQYIVVSGTEGNELRILNLDTPKTEIVLEGHTQFVTGVSFTPDGRHVLSVSADGQLKVWDRETARAVRRWP